MKLDKPIYVVWDHNANYIGAYSEEAIADKVAEFAGAYVTKISEVSEELPENVADWDSWRKTYRETAR